MSQNYIRVLSLTLSTIGATYDATGIRVRFKIKQSTLGQPNTATIMLTNQNPGKAKALCAAFGGYVGISAGYAGNTGLIFQGDLRRAIYGRENPTDTLTTILASDGGQAHSYATVAKTLPAGSTPQAIVDTSIGALQKFGVSLGFVGPSVNLATPVYPRSIALVGMAWKLLADVAKSKGATTSIQNSKVHIVGPNDSIPGGAFELNSTTGLIGMPTLETGAVFARTLINPQMKFHSLVHIDQSLVQGMLPALTQQGAIAPGFEPSAPQMSGIAADGMYRIFRIDVDGDTRGEPWYQDLQMNPVGGHVTPVEQFSSGGLGGAGP